jgi:hypothetical protein
VHGSIAEGLAAPRDAPTTALARATVIVTGGVLVLAAILLYVVSNQTRYNQYDHFVWQADAFLNGRVWIPYPVPENEYFQDVYPISPTQGLLPFPPLPALVLVPFVWVFGFHTDQELLAAVLAGVAVGLAYWMLGKLPIRLWARIAITVLFAAGTVFWWTAASGTTWYFAHIVAIIPVFAAIGRALGADRAAVVEPLEAGPPGRSLRQRLGAFLDDTLPLDGPQLVNGLLLGVAATARLPVVLGLPFFMFVGSGGTWQRRSLSAGIGASIPVLALLSYNLATTGSFFHPGYEWQYQREQGYTALGYHADWSIEDIRYIPQNLGIMFGSLPSVLPDVRTTALGPDFIPEVPLCTTPGAVRSLFDRDCPLALPHDIGTSVLFVTPALLLLVPVLRWIGRRRLVAGAALSILLIGLLNVAHFSQGWVQWGYRFSNDFMPFALPLVALGASGRDGRLRLIAFALIVASVLINLWGVMWGNLLGW